MSESITTLRIKVCLRMNKVIMLGWVLLIVGGIVWSGTLTDDRDGKTYRTVEMPDGRTWMAENLNLKTDSGSWCYEDSIFYCDKYGRLYDWGTAIAACPSGWHLPSNHQEWDSLAQAVGGKRNYDYGFIHWYGAGKKLKARNDWNKNGNGSTDDYGFTALPGGYRDYKGRFNTVGRYGYWWTATEADADAYYRYMGYHLDGEYEYYDRKSTAFSVRCVKDTD